MYININGRYYTECQKNDQVVENISSKIEEYEIEYARFLTPYVVNGDTYNILLQGYYKSALLYVDPADINLLDSKEELLYGLDFKAVRIKWLDNFDCPLLDFENLAYDSYALWEYNYEKQEADGHCFAPDSDDYNILTPLMEYFDWGEIMDEKLIELLELNELTYETFEEDFLRALSTVDFEVEPVFLVRKHLGGSHVENPDHWKTDNLCVEHYYLMYLYWRVFSIPNVDSKLARKFAKLLYNHLEHKYPNGIKELAPFMENHKVINDIEAHVSNNL